MTSLQQRYTELLALTKTYLQQEHSLTDRILSESDTYSYFKNYALQSQKAKSQQNSPSPAIVANTAPKMASPAHARTPITDLPQPTTIQAAKAHENIEVRTDKSDFNKTVTVPLSPAPTNKTPPKPEKTENSSEQTSVTGFFKLEFPSALPQTDFSDLRTIIQQKLPNVRLLDQLPDDTEAKKMASIWSQEKKIPQVLILSFDDVPKHQAFLSNIAKALEIHGIDAKVANAAKLERENEWQKLLQSKELKLVIAGSSGFYNLPELQKNYREGTKQGRHHLGDRLLLLLSDISYYLKEPTLKPSLWGALKELLANTSPSL